MSVIPIPAPAEMLAEARLNIHAAVAECGERRRMFAHHAATLSADAALHPDAEASQRAMAQCYLDETAGLLARAADRFRGRLKRSSRRRHRPGRTEQRAGAFDHRQRLCRLKLNGHATNYRACRALVTAGVSAAGGESQSI